MHQIPRGDEDWVPPHCPNRNCAEHNNKGGSWPWRKRGFYVRGSDTRRVQRYECRTCGVTFSTQTFDVTYWLKRPEVHLDLLEKTVGCMAGRQIARQSRCAPETVNRQTARLGRHALLFLQQRRIPPRGPLVIDGFETFAHSQYGPCHIHLAVEAETHFLLHFNVSPLRRKGRMTDRQKRRRAELERIHGRPHPQAIRHEVQDLLGVVLEGVPKTILHSDEHTAYPPAIRAVACEIDHRVTNSRKPRNPQNPLFPVNLADLLLRHCQSQHKRETIAFNKRLNAMMEKTAIFAVWRNFMKQVSEKRRSPTPAMLRGLADHPLKTPEILRERLFPDRIGLPDAWRRYYDRALITPQLGRNRRHDLKYAY